jgi:hypothetical protein
MIYMIQLKGGVKRVIRVSKSLGFEDWSLKYFPNPTY